MSISGGKDPDYEMEIDASAQDVGGRSIFTGPTSAYAPGAEDRATVLEFKRVR